jgi:O-antigen/teichoic acid export membrane protein
VRALTLKEEELQSEESHSSEIGTRESRHITRGIGSLTIQNLATSALGFVFLAVLLRLLPNVDYGVYSAMAVSVGIGSVIAPMGLQYAAAKFLADVDNAGELRSRAKKIILLSILTSSVASAVFVIFSNSLSLYFTKSTSWSGAFVVGGLWLFSSSLESAVQGTIQGLKKYTLLAGMLFAARLAMVILTIVGLELTHNFYVSLYAWIIYFAMLIGWSARILVVSLPKGNIPSNHVTSSPESLSYRDLLRYSLPLGIAGIFFVLTTQVDIVVVGGDMNPSALGIYNTAVTISSVLNFVLITPLITALLPEASFRIRNLSEISNGMRLAIRFVFLSVLPASLLVAAVAPQLLALFSGGARYESGSVPLQIIAVFYIAFAVQYVIYSILQAKGKTLQVFMISAVSAATIYGLSILLVPSAGLVGASVARSVSAIVGLIFACYIAKEFLKDLDRSNFYLRATISAAGPFVVVWSLTTFVSSKTWTIVPYTLIGAGMFLGCLFFLRVLNNEDREFLLSALPSSLRQQLSTVLGKIVKEL